MPARYPDAFRCHWRAVTRPPALAPDRVHLWRLRLDLSRERIAELAGHLSPGEQERAARFRLPPVRDRYIAGRGTLRELLALYLGIKPAEVAFAYSMRGKPQVYGNGTDVRFNMADSGALALVGLALGRECGVDVERRRRDLDPLEIAGRFFSPAEAAALAALPLPERRRAFFCAWTAKEAFLKGTGEGIFGGLDRLVGWPPCSTPQPVRLNYGHEDQPDWHLLNISPAPGYAGSLVVAGGGWQVVCLRQATPAT